MKLIGQKPSILVLVFLIISKSLLAQENTVSAGNNATNNNFEIDFTIGQVFSFGEPTTNSSYFGLQIPFEGYETSQLNPLNASRIALFPNPTTGIIYLKTEAINIINKVTIYDFQGQKLGEYQVSDHLVPFDLTIYRSGIYLIDVYQDELFKQSFKVIKI